MLSLLSLSGCLSSSVYSSTGSFDPATTQQIDTIVREQMAAQNLPGVVVLVSVPGQGEYQRAFGDANLTTHSQRRLDDPFRIASGIG